MRLNPWLAEKDWGGPLVSREDEGMRLAFSTLGCPAWDLEQILAAAREAGYEGIEWRGYREEMELPRASIFTGVARAETRRRFRDAGLQFVSLGSSVRLSDPAPEARRSHRDALAAHVELAASLDCPLVRVFGGKLPAGVRREEALPGMAAFLRELAEIAARSGVGLVVETHDDFSTGEQVAELLCQTDHPAVGSLWDLHHPYREGEAPETTVQVLGPTLRHTHVKDSRDGRYCLMGEGDVPLAGMIGLLRGRGYDGWVSVEWEKRWHPEIAEPEVVLPQYARKLRELL
jgi:sugar phosphate isomerase/epimerase